MPLNTAYTISYPSFPYPPCAEYRSSNTYTAGVLATSKWYTRDPNAACENAIALPFLTLDRSIDPTTGMIAAERDSAELASTFVYDSIGRLRSSTPPSGVSTIYDYYRAGTVAHVAINTMGPNGSVLSSDIRYDAFGRVVERMTRAPDGTWPSRLTVYDDKGRVSHESEQELSPSHFTEFSDFDAFDRPRRIESPDGSRTELTYSGTSKTSRKRWYESELGSVEATVHEEYDAAGRLYHLTDADGTVTQYTYDVADRLIKVERLGSTQIRSFTYDGRGFLVAESHPEAGPIAYTYDSLGNVKTKRYSTWTPYDLNYSYDGAGRLEKVESRNPSSPSDFRIAKRYVYATDNDTDEDTGLFSYRKGKLESSTRHNNLPTVPDLGVTETFIYDLDGRVTTKTTTVGRFPDPHNSPEYLTNWQQFIEGYSYNEVGARSQVRLAGCTILGCASSPTNQFDYLHSSLNASKLESIPSMVSWISYLPNGMHHTLGHMNGTTDTQTIDSSTAMARPASISTEYWVPCTATVPTDRWKGEYFNNKDLSGAPSLTRDDGQGNLLFNFGNLGPNACGVGSDQFSARWTRTVNFAAGTYRFTAAADDGIRLRIDGVLKIDKWIDQGTTTYTADVTLTAGNHTIIMEFYENAGGAFASLSWEPIASVVDGATFVSQSVPASMIAGQTYSVSVTMKNSGTSTWTGSGFRLGSANPQDNTRWGLHRVNLPAGVSIPPNANHTFTFNVTAPTTAGSYNFQWRIVYDWVAWFSASSTNAIVNVGGVTDHSTFVSQSVPTTMAAGQTYQVSVTLNNSGTSTWVTNDFRLGSMNPQDNTRWGLNRVNVPAGTSVPPGANHTFTFNVTAPTTPGNYNFQWLMIHEWVAWFGAYTPNLIINVGGVTDNSTFVSQSVPTTMAAGQSYAVSVTLKNSGTSTWVTNDFRLGSMNPQDNTRWGLNRVNVPAGTSVPPGANHMFTFNVTAPTTPGNYNFQWLMIHEWVAWFGAYTPNLIINVGGVTDNSTFVSQSVPTTMARGQTYSVSVTLNNSGTSTWVTNDFRLGSMNPQDNVTWGLNRVNVPAGAGVAPGANHTFTFSVTAPSTAGTYNFRWLMIHEWVAWFGAYTPNLSVNVQ